MSSPAEIFTASHVAFVLDFLGIALSALAGISERRLERMVNPALSEGLPPFLAAGAGLNSGFMMPQVAAASLVSENKVLAHPASVDSITTSGNKEDYVSMGMTAALKLKKIVENTRNAMAIEAMAAAQALDFLAPLKTSKTRAGGPRGDSVGMRDHGQGSSDVSGFRADRGIDCQRKGCGGAAVVARAGRRHAPTKAERSPGRVRTPAPTWLWLLRLSLPSFRLWCG